MPLALTGPEWGVLLVSVVPLVLAIVVVYLFWRWAKRSEADEAAQRQADDDD
jgi:membrane protein implicated in regulation of membrane protease activity